MLKAKPVALTLGFVFAVLHGLGTLFMSGLVPFAQKYHFVSFQYTAQPFSFGIWITGIIAAFAAGNIVGWLYTTIYNKVA